MHEFGGVPDGDAVELAERLHAEADPQHGDRALGALGDGPQGGAGAGGVAGAGRDEDAVVGAVVPLGVHRVIADDVDPGAEVAQVPDDRVHEGVVVVDAQDARHLFLHGAGPRPGRVRSGARRRVGADGTHSTRPMGRAERAPARRIRAQ